MTALSPPRKSLQLHFAQVDVYDRYLIVTVHEDVVFQKPHLEALYDIFLTYFPSQPFGYIAHRKYSYTVDPTCYIDSQEGPWLAAMAVVCYSQAAYEAALFERKFYKNRPYRPFYQMSDCLEWMERKISEHQIDRPPIGTP